MKNALVIGLGFVGLSNAIFLSKNIKITAYDNDKDKINLLKNNKSPFKDNSIENYLKDDTINFKVSSDKIILSESYDLVIIALPTNYSENDKCFDTSSIEYYLDFFSKNNPNATVLIKSTIPIGFCNSMEKRFDGLKIIFSPEFLREGHALTDCFYPSRLIISGEKSSANKFAKLCTKSFKIKNVPTMLINHSEAESIKLFSNAYLANRVAFFNELDSFSLKNNLETNVIIEGLSLDNRIGKKYNNPSFGYGGYCLPKDTKQLLNNFDNIPQSLIESIVTSNEKRKSFLANEILEKNPHVVGVYRLSMKRDSDSIRSSATIDIIKIIEKKVEVLIYEPCIESNTFLNSKVIDDLDYFMDNSDLIIADRFYKELKKVKNKIFTRDILGPN